MVEEIKVICGAVKDIVSYVTLAWIIVVGVRCFFGRG